MYADEETYVIREDHPALAGHFPGDAIVPGVLILEEVLNALVQRNGEATLAGLPSVKFLSPLRPGQPFAIRLMRSEPSKISFACVSRGRTLAEGRLELRLPGA